MPETTEELHRLVATAEETIAAAAVVAGRDPKRPRYHFRAPAQWMDDPNGIIYRDGWYHMMYSLTPFSSTARAGMVYKTAVRVWDPQSPDWTGGITVWGHARSRDLVHWEHLPIALYPSIDRGEHFIWFGCTVINGDGVPMAIYTAVGPELRPEDTAQQWAALGSDDLLSWTPLPSNPLLTDAIHGDETITEWRDPFLFEKDGRQFLILGGRDADGKPVVTLYEALDRAFTSWSYRGVVFRHPEGDFPSGECPNFAFVDGEWVLLLSRHSTVEYFIGELDVDAVTFTPSSRGMVDHSSDFYATNVLYDDRGRCLMWGAIEGFGDTSGWNGCVSLPRQLRIVEGRLVQSVVAELESLRGAQAVVEVAAPSGTVQLADLPGDGTFEVELIVEHESGAEFTVELAGPGRRVPIVVGADATIDSLRVAGRADTTRTTISVWVDRTVVEAFVEGDLAATTIGALWGDRLAASVTSGAGSVHRVSGSVWALAADDLFRTAR